MGVVIAQLAVFAAARRAGRIPPADALREVAIEHPRPGLVRVVCGVACLLGGVAMSILFSGFWAMAFAVLGGILLAMGTGLLGRWLLGIPAAVLAAPLRRFGASGTARRAPGWRRTAGAPRRWRHRSCSSRCSPAPRASSSPATSVTPRTSRALRVRRAARRRRRRRRAPARRHRRRDREARRRRRGHRAGADRGLSARRRSRRPGPVDGRGPRAARRRRARSTRTWSTDRCVTSTATPSPSAACSRTAATCGSATACRSGWPTRPPPRSASPRSTTAQPDSETCCSIRPSHDATQRSRPTPRCSSPAARPPPGRSRATRPTIPACGR